MQCLDAERQGNCHDPDVWKIKDDKARMSRHQKMLNNMIMDSPGILNASDPWVWESDLEPYKVLPADDRDKYISRVRKIFGGKHPLRRSSSWGTVASPGSGSAVP